MTNFFGLTSLVQNLKTNELDLKITIKNIFLFFIVVVIVVLYSKHNLIIYAKYLVEEFRQTAASRWV